MKKMTKRGAAWFTAVGLIAASAAATPAFAAGPDGTVDFTSDYVVSLSDAGSPAQTWEWEVTDDSGWALNDAEFTSGGRTDDAFDNYGSFSVEGNFYLSLVTGATTATQVTAPNGDVTLTGAVNSMSGLDVSGTWTFFAHKPVARNVATFTNPGTDPISVEVEYGGNMGADSSNQVVLGSHDGLFVSHDGPNGDPIITHALSDADYDMTFSTALVSGNDLMFATYDITVAPGETVHLLWYVAMRDYAGGAESAALSQASLDAEADFLSPDARLADGDFTLTAVLNWTFLDPDTEEEEDEEEDDDEVTVINRPGYTG
jgi:hypothetical protein